MNSPCSQEGSGSLSTFMFGWRCSWLTGMQSSPQGLCKHLHTSVDQTHLGAHPAALLGFTSLAPPLASHLVSRYLGSLQRQCNCACEVTQ